MKIALIPNFQKNGTSELLDWAYNILSGGGAECFVPDTVKFSSCKMPEEALFKACDIILTIGGDGTLLKYAKAASKYQKPCLGINTGRLGFLANLEKDNIELLGKLLTGDYTVESRMMLSVKAVKAGKVIYESLALNDAVVSGGRAARIADLRLNVAGDEIDYRADGIIISTPTGSTAYSMSAGGPIIAPTVRCITVTPICSHSLTARPMISDENTKMTLRHIETSHTDAYLTVDGDCCVNVDFDTEIQIEKAPYDAGLINISKSTIYKTVSLKF